GTITADDCDDTTASSTIKAEDADCDGVLTAADCDDNNSASTTVGADADCDGAATALDCDDTDENLGAFAADADCDGTLTADDCDDSSADSTTVATDADCDGVLTAADCDDNNANKPALDQDCDNVPTGFDCDDTDMLTGGFADDNDCDGVASADDCNDEDATEGSNVDDTDCDGLAAILDCNDGDDEVGAIALDGDCDGTPINLDCDDASDLVGGGPGNDRDCDNVDTVVDCDDTDPTQGAGPAGDADCDGFPTADDCDDDTNKAGSILTDADCDGVPFWADCDDDNATVFSDLGSNDKDCDGVDDDNDCDDLDSRVRDSSADADCDGALDEVDCDWQSADTVGIADDADCDGVLMADDCDDNDVAFGAIALDGDCDGVLAALDCADADPTVGAVAQDADCDGVVDTADCDPASPAIGAGEAGDLDCDGVAAADDCDDTDNTLGASADDVDCDGVLTAMDCDDNVAALGAAWDDADCDGVADLASLFKPDGAPAALFADCVTPTLCLSRYSSKTLTNLLLPPQEKSVTPAGTQWAMGYPGSTENFSSLDGLTSTLPPFASASSLPFTQTTMMDDKGAMHSIYFHRWSRQKRGGVAYGRAPATTFEKVSLADWTQAENQDCVAPGVCITRKTTSSIFNISAEGASSQASPAGTQWAMGATRDVAPSDYQTFRQATQNNPQGAVGQVLSLHVLSLDVYYDVVLTGWAGGGPGGGFSWVRSRAIVPGCMDPADPAYDSRANLDNGFCGWTYFEKAPFAAGMDPANQDCLAPNVCLARNDSEGLYNARFENSYQELVFNGPYATQWAPGLSADVTPDAYGTWVQMHGECPICRLFAPASLRAGPDYFDIFLVKWSAGPDNGGPGGGGFAYYRRPFVTLNQD
ncbi:MAG: hypothetical protein ACI9WU_000040, partial [Myxococcota bacterium]